MGIGLTHSIPPGFGPWPNYQGVFCGLRDISVKETVHFLTVYNIITNNKQVLDFSYVLMNATPELLKLLIIKKYQMIFIF